MRLQRTGSMPHGEAAVLLDDPHESNCPFVDTRQPATGDESIDRGAGVNVVAVGGSDGDEHRLAFPSVLRLVHGAVRGGNQRVGHYVLTG